MHTQHWIKKTLTRWLILSVTCAALFCASGCKTPTGADWTRRELTILEQGEPAPFDGVLMTNRLFMKLFEDVSRDLLIEEE